MPADSPLRVLVVDDHPLYRASAAYVLRRRGMDVVAQCDDGRQALAAMRAHAPQVALVDRYMPHLDGFDVLHAVLRAALPTRVVLISGFFDGEDIYRALEQGATGVLTKTVDERELADVVEAAARGETVVGRDLHGHLATDIRARAGQHGALLTEREQAVLQLMARGLLVPAIARELHISPSTVKSHTQNLFEKLRVNERAAAVAAAMRMGLLD